MSRQVTISPEMVARTARKNECELCLKLFQDTMFRSALSLASTVEEYQNMAKWFERELQERIVKLQESPHHI